MSEQYDRQATAIQRPTSTDPGAWKAYWETKGQEWRIEPEISSERQQYLAKRRSITPDTEKGIYPFKDVKLNRSDVEWLLATHADGQGPVDWNDENQREREGLDLRGANLRQANLSHLPLARMRGGLTNHEKLYATYKQSNMAAAQLQEADLREAHLQEATFNGAQLRKANLGEAQLQGTNLWMAHLEEANFWRAKLQGAVLVDAHLQGADLWSAQLQGAVLDFAQLQGTNLQRADLENAKLDGVTLSDQTHGSASIADIRWGEVNLAVIDWRHVTRLGDEQLVQKEKDLEGYKEAVRANRQLAVVLRNQGLNEEADHFAYRAQLLQRKVLWRDHEFGRWLFSMLLALLSGYGYRIWRIFAAYILTVSLFALAYFVLGMHYSPHLPLDQAYLESITALHGRVFLEQFNPHTPQIWLTAFEAIAGLIIEGVFIAMLIQRFFGK